LIKLFITYNKKLALGIEKMIGTNS